MQLHIQSLTGLQFHLKLTAPDTNLSIGQIKSSLPFPSQSIQLYHNGVCCSDSATISTYNIRNEDTLIVMYNDERKDALKIYQNEIERIKREDGSAAGSGSARLIDRLGYIRRYPVTAGTSAAATTGAATAASTAASNPPSTTAFLRSTSDAEFTQLEQAYQVLESRRAKRRREDDPSTSATASSASPLSFDRNTSARRVQLMPFSSSDLRPGRVTMEQIFGERDRERTDRNNHNNQSNSSDESKLRDDEKLTIPPLPSSLLRSDTLSSREGKSELDNKTNEQVDANKLAQLETMGFSTNAATRALLVSHNNVGLASNWLLEHSSDNGINDPISSSERATLARIHRGIRVSDQRFIVSGFGEQLRRLIRMGISETDAMRQILQTTRRT